MSRSSHQRQQQQLLAQQQQQMADNDAAAAAAEMFDMFCLATTMRQVLGLHRNMCDTVGLRPAPLNEFYPKLKAKIRSWKAQALWKKFDARAAHRAYSKGNACTGTRVLVIGAGPCGLRTAIEAQLLGAKVVVLEKRDRISRNNVLHLWPFVITDLRNLGAKKFYGKFCAGSIDHISIRQLQCILLKVALLLGVEIHEGISFERTIEPSEGCGWRAAVTPEDHAVSHYEFDVLIGADGKRNTLEAFKRKEFRGKLAIAITANFINKKTEAEAKAEEISGVAFIFNQTFFKELYHTTGIDLENIVYYKDETHYFVMTAKKHSLIDKGVILQDFADPAELLAPPNVNTEKLLDYAREAAEFSTKYQMPNLEFAVNHYGKPDVAMFDFTSMFAAESSCRVIVRKNYRLMQCLVGDSLLEPFWPTGSGCARGFLSSMDAAYAIKLWSNPRNSTLGVVAQRESIYRLLAQTTPENLQRDIGSYTVDPATRYPNLNRTSVNVWQVKHLIDCDDKSILEQTFMDTNALQASQAETPVRRKRRTGDTLPLSAVLLRWIKAQLHSYDFSENLTEVSDCFTNGKVLCALINRYRPDLVDFNLVKDLPAPDCNDLAFKILDKELGISRVMSGKDSIELDKIDSKIWLNYLEQICEVFRGEIPHVKHPKLDVSELREKNRNNAPDFSKLLQISSRKAKSPMQDVADLPHIVQRRSVLDEEKVKRQRKHESGQAQAETPRRAKKRRSAEKTQNIEERQQRLQEIEANRQDRQSKRRLQRFQQTQNFYKSLHMLQANTFLRESDESSPFEDYSIYMYRQQAPIFNDRVKELERKLLYPDRERGIPSALPRGADEQFSDRIKSMEQRITSRNTYGTDKKPKDLLRAIGKIDSNDWNVREIEKKIEQSKKTEIGGKGREKVPKWSREQFAARQSKMSKPVRQDSGEEKFKEIDQTLKNLDKQLKEGSVLEVGERGKNKVASIAGQFVKKDDTSEEKNPPPIAKSNSKVALAFKKQAASEKCHFCKQTVYLMEKISTEGLILHRSCLKCHHCHTNLRLGGYAFDRDDPEGRFYCTQHFRLPAKAIRPVVRKPGQRKSTAQGTHAAVDPKTAEKPRGIAENVAQLDLLDRGQTPERIEFENTDAMSDGEPSEEHIIDENEWSGRNFLQPSAESESDLSSSSDESDDDSESDIFEEANGSPIAQQTLQLATDWIGKQHYSNVNSDDSDNDFYDSSEGLIDDGKDDTEGEEFKKAREMRREEVRLLPLPTNLPTDTETEKQTQVIGPQDGVNAQTIDDESNSREKLNFDADKISITSRGSDQIPTASKADIEKIEQSSDSRLSADVDAISEKLYRLNNLMKLSKDIENMAKENLVKSDILKKLSLKEKWLLDNSVSNVSVSPIKELSQKKVEDKSKEIVEMKINSNIMENPNLITTEISKETPVDKLPKAVSDGGDDDRGDGLTHRPLLLEEKPNEPTTVEVEIDGKSSEPKGLESKTDKSISELTSIQTDKKPTTTELQTDDKSTELNKVPDKQKANAQKISADKMEIEGILDIVKMMDISYIEQSEKPLPKPEASSKSKRKDVGKMLYEAEHKNENRSSDALRQIEVKNFAGTMDTIKSQIVAPTISHQSSLDISKYFPNAKQEKQSSAAANKNQKTLKDVDLTKYFPQSPVPQRKSSVITVADRLKRSQTMETVTPVEEIPKAPPRRQKSMADKAFSMHEHLLDGAIDIQKAHVAKPVAKKGGIKIVKKIVSKGSKTKKEACKKIQDESDKILDEILQMGQEVRSPSLEYQKLFTEEKSPSEDISEKIEKILEETGIKLGLPPKPKKKLLKAKSLGEGEFKRTQEELMSKEDGDRPMGVQKILQRFESMSSIKSDDSFRLRKSNLSSTCGSLNKSRESLRSKESLKSQEDTMTDLEKTMEYLKSEWKTEATNFLQQKRDSFYSNRVQKQAEAEAEAKKSIQPKPQWKQTKYSKFFGIKEKSPEKRKSPTKSNTKRKSPAKVLKKSPREEILKHRKKLESVSSRRASFEEKIKAEEARLKAEEVIKASKEKNSSIQTQAEVQNNFENLQANNENSVDTQQSFTEVDKNQKTETEAEEPSINGSSEAPINQNRQEISKSVEINKNCLDIAQKLLNRRGSGARGLADVLKPPVVKGVRGDRPKADSNDINVNSLSINGSETKDMQLSKPDLVNKTSKEHLNNETENETSKPIQKILTNQNRKGSQNTVECLISEGQLQNVEKDLTNKAVEKTMQVSSKRSSSSTPTSQTPLRDIPQNLSSRRVSPDNRGTKTPQNQSRDGSQTENKIQHDKNIAEIVKTPPQQLSRRGSAAVTLSRRSSNISESADQTISIDDITDVDDIFNEIVNELENDENTPKDVKALFHSPVVEQVELVAISTEMTEKEQEPNESQQINEEFEKIAKHSRSQSACKQSRASSEDSIEKLFSEFTDDMLVDVEFDSNGEVVAITPRAIIVKEDKEEEEEEEKQITVEEAKLKFEPLFPGQKQNVTKSTSSSLSLSPARAGSKAKKLDPANMAPSVQDMIQKVMPRIDYPDVIPIAFPRNYYELEEETTESSRSKSPTPKKSKSPTKKKDNLEIVYQLAWPARKRVPSPVPESARPPIKPSSRRGSSNPTEILPHPIPTSSPEKSQALVEPESNLRSGSELSATQEDLESVADKSNSLRGSKSSLLEDVPTYVQSASPALLPTPRRNSRTSIENELGEMSVSAISSRRGSKASLKGDDPISVQEEINPHRQSPALLPKPRRESNTSLGNSSPARDLGPSTEFQPLDKPNNSNISQIVNDLEPFVRDSDLSKESLEKSLADQTKSTVLPFVSQQDLTKLDKGGLLLENLEISVESLSCTDNHLASNDLDIERQSLLQSIAPKQNSETKVLDSQNSSRRGSKTSHLKETSPLNAFDIPTPKEEELINITLSLKNVQSTETAAVPDDGDNFKSQSDVDFSSTLELELPTKNKKYESSLHSSVSPRSKSKTKSRSNTAELKTPSAESEVATHTPKSLSKSNSPAPPFKLTSQLDVSNNLKSKRDVETLPEPVPEPQKLLSKSESPFPYRKNTEYPFKPVEFANSTDMDVQCNLESLKEPEALTERGITPETQELSKSNSPTLVSPPLWNGTKASQQTGSAPSVSSSKSNSPLTARERFFAQNQCENASPDRDMSKIPNSLRNSKERIITKSQTEPEPPREYNDILRAKLESPLADRRSEHMGRSKEKSLEWDMEQLPNSPMPRRKFVDTLLQTTKPQVDVQSAASLVKNVPETESLQTKNKNLEEQLPSRDLEEWEIIEQLEEERRMALIKRDENYSHQAQEPLLHNPHFKSVSWQKAPHVNRRESFEDPPSSRLIEYLKEQTLGETAKFKESKHKEISPNLPSRSRTPQLSKKISQESLDKQVEALLKPQDSVSHKSIEMRQKPHKTESIEATYEDFARFTRKHDDRESEREGTERDSSPILSHRPSSYRQRSQESATGTYSPTNSLSKSIEHLAPLRPIRSKQISSTDDRIDRETKHLMDRSEHLRNMKRDFMEEKIAGNNPYLKKAIAAQKFSSHLDNEEDDDVDYALESYRPKNHPTPRFPTSSSISNRRRREPRYPDYSSPIDYTRRPYNPHFSNASTTSSIGSRNFVDYFKRSPPHYRVRDSSKDSCIIS